ncbi:hypothetical protein D3C80_388280 [compost metagenome]
MTDKAFEFVALEGATSLHQAQIGDLSIILERLRDGSSLLTDEREFLADLIEGKWRRPANNPVALAVRLRNEEIVEEVTLIRSLLPEARHVVNNVARAFGVTPRHVYALIQATKADPKDQARLERRTKFHVDLHQELEIRIAASRRGRLRKLLAERRRRSGGANL